MSRWLKRLAGVLLVVVLAVVVVAWLLLRGSLPHVDGELALPGLSAPVAVSRDALGVATIDASSEADAMRALGYVHAQERYFEMDLMRRSAAGELAELFGPAAIEADAAHRVHRLRARARADMAAIVGAKGPVLQAYVEGVNAGLRDLPVRPWPYLVLRQVPRPWTLEDSALAGFAMYFDLQDARNGRELALWRIGQVVPPALHALLLHDGSRWDAPLLGRPRGDAVLPGPSALDLRTLAAPRAAQASTAGEANIPGSNNFAVSGALTGDGRAIVADDMHLGLRAPNIWFRARLRWPDARAPGRRVDTSGFTLPGLPVVVVGSNGHVAWGFTNAYADTADWALLPRGTPVVTRQETIHVAGAAPVALAVREAAWGPVLHTQDDGRALALRWVAQLPGALRIGLMDFAVAADLDAAYAIADRASIPAQNLVIADSGGRIGWRSFGALPARGQGCDGARIAEETPAADRPAAKAAGASAAGAATAPGSNASTAQPCPPWPIATATSPQLRDPPSGRLWTANARTADGAALATLGDAGYDLGARAGQIRDALFARDRFEERDLLAIQLDDRALFLHRWWRLLREVVAKSDDPALRRLEAASRDWSGRASVDSTSYRMAHAFRGNVLDTLRDGLLAPARARLGPDFIEPRLPQFEAVAWPMVTQRPAHLLPPPYTNWNALLADAARALEADLSIQGTDLSARTWGERNTAAICHPMARALPAFARPLLCMPADALPGDSNMPRVAGPDFGASQRMVVSPGHEADGIIHMPGGQSGNPLSPFWGAGHEDWVRGRPTPFLPGPARYRLRMVPAVE